MMVVSGWMEDGIDTAFCGLHVCLSRACRSLQTTTVTARAAPASAESGKRHLRHIAHQPTKPLLRINLETRKFCLLSHALSPISGPSLSLLTFSCSFFMYLYARQNVTIIMGIVRPKYTNNPSHENLCMSSPLSSNLTMSVLSSV